jgi:cytochrome c biogenesis protein CcmG/thiol:disulfide interchange protein DsbE
MSDIKRRPRRLVVLLPLIVFAGLAALFLGRLDGGDPSLVPSPLIGKAVPAFELPAIDGLADDKGMPTPGLRDADLKKGVAVVNVFASWCAPCRAEHPLLSALAADGRFRLVGIDYKDTADQAKRFLGALGNPFSAIGADENGRVGIDWGVYGVPETYVVADGRIVYKHVGPLTPAAIADELKPAIETALNTAPGAGAQPATP